MAPSQTRAKMVAGATRLLAENGLDGTSFADVLAAVGAPRGSTYHHFPGGKAQLIDEAIQLAGDHALAAMEPARGHSAPDVARRFLGLWRALLNATELRAGCAVLAVTVAGDDGGALDHAGRIFRAWREQLAQLYTAGGLTEEHATQFAALTIAATEGAVALTRAERDWAPFDLVESYLIGEAERAVSG